MNEQSLHNLLSFGLGVAVCFAWITVTSQKNDKNDQHQIQKKDATLETSESSKIGFPNPLISKETAESDYKNCIYLDYNATTPIYSEVYHAMNQYLMKYFGNPSSSHVYGKISAQTILRARKNIAEQLIGNQDEKEIYFTSCGTESDNWAIDIALHHYKIHTQESNRDTLPVVITSAIEHLAVLCYLRLLAQVRKEIELVILPVNSEGFISLEDLKKSLSTRTALVTIMHSNNEVGTIQPIRLISRAIQEFNRNNNTSILFHSDAAQSIGKVPVDVISLGVDMLTIVGHKFGAPKGIGALYVSKRVSMRPSFFGGGQEFGMRAGTENVPYIVALGEASNLAAVELPAELLHLLTMKHRLLSLLMQMFADKLDKVQLNGPRRSTSVRDIADDLKMIRMLLNQTYNSNRPCSLQSLAKDIQLDCLPNTISISFKDINAHDIVHALSDKVACSAGAACHAAPPKGESRSTENVYTLSEVLAAMQVNPVFGLGTIRLSVGRHTTTDDIDRAARFIHETVCKLWSKE